MAELHIIGQLKEAINFEEPKLFCKWNIQTGTSWSLIEGENEGQTVVSINRVEDMSSFAQPFDIHLSSRGIQGWPKFQVEVYAVNGLQYSWPVGYGFVHIPTRPGNHTIEIHTWKIEPNGFWDRIKQRFWSGGFALSKNDLVHSGIERYKLQTRTSGKIVLEICLVFRNFSKFGIEFM